MWQPKIGQRVELHYRADHPSRPALEGATGTVSAVGGPPRGPRNATVQLDGGGLVIVPRGNLVALPPEERLTFRQARAILLRDGPDGRRRLRRSRIVVQLDVLRTELVLVRLPKAKMKRRESWTA